MKKMVILIILCILVVSATFIVKANVNEINLNGYVIYIDAGHGGKDNGASYDEVLEDSINLSISSLLLKDLVEVGAIVVTSRDGDYDLASNYDKNRKNKDLKTRVELINEIKPDIFISIHLNTYPDNNVSGGQVFAQKSENSELLANSIQKRLNSMSNKNKKHKTGDYYLLNKSNSVGVIIECGFLTNNTDRRNLVKEEYQKEISKNILYGIYEYFDKK